MPVLPARTRATDAPAPLDANTLERLGVGQQVADTVQNTLPTRRRATSEQPAVFGRYYLDLHPSLSYGDWLVLCRHVSAMAEHSPWWWGDLLVYGEDKFGDDFAQAVDLTGRNQSTIRGWAWTARRFPPGKREHDLEISHYYEVARLVTLGREELAHAMLERAEAESLTVHQLRREVQTWKAQHDPDYAPITRALPVGTLEALQEAFGVPAARAHEGLDALRRLGYDVVKRWGATK